MKTENLLDLGPVQTSCCCCAQLNSGIKFNRSTAKARYLIEAFELNSSKELV